MVWQLVSVEQGPSARLTLRYVSPDGDQGYPGTLTATALYAIDAKGDVSVTYTATTDKPTIVNISNHTYWNLAGEGSERGALGELLTIPADEYTPTDATSIPTGEFRKVQGTVFDFRKSTPIGARVRDASDPQIRYGRGYVPRLNSGHDRTGDSEPRTWGGRSPPHASHIPSRPLLTRTFTATRRFCALPSTVSLFANGSASDIPVGVSMRYGFQPQAC